MRCAKCYQAITGHSYRYHYKDYHEACLLKVLPPCQVCGKSMSDPWVTTNKDTLFFHEACLDQLRQSLILHCDFCQQPIEGTYREWREKPLHVECFEEKGAVLCAVCQEPIGKKFLLDFFDNPFHQKHQNMARCGCCHRIIAGGTTGGEGKLADGRMICHACQQTGITKKEQMREPYRQVLDFLKTQEILFAQPVRLKLMDQHQIRKILDPMAVHNHTVGFATIPRIPQLTESDCHISMLYGLPQYYFMQVLAHELLHCWIAVHSRGQPLGRSTEEGICEYLGFLLLRNHADPEARAFAQMSLANSDRIYGKGLRDIKRYVEQKSLGKLLHGLREGKANFEAIIDLVAGVG
ncbi:MAG: protein DA1 [SAR324 cluster bacterium]|nr:protein DA1 [SAR324 cluster bacterium]